MTAARGDVDAPALAEGAGETGVQEDALELVSVDEAAVTFRVGEDLHRVTMREETLEPHPVSCGAEPTEPAVWRPVDVSP